jgi:hypothetical protein
MSLAAAQTIGRTSMFKAIGVTLLVVAGLGFLFDWEFRITALTFGLGFLAIGVVVNPRVK